ncbi:MAG: type II secretion system protein GspL [Sedimenticola sp.]
MSDAPQGVLVRLPEMPGDALTWVELDSRGRPRGEVQQGEMKQLVPVVGDKPLTLLAPGCQVWLGIAESPARNRRQLAKALPYALEDEFTEEVESLHFAMGEQQGGRVAVAVIRKELISEWKLEAASLGLQLADLKSELHAVPWLEKQWTLLCDGGRMLVRTGAMTGFSCESANAQLLLKRLIAEEAPDNLPAIIRCIGCDEVLIVFLEGALDEPVFTVVADNSGASVIASLAFGSVNTPALSLLQGEFGQQVPLREFLHPWRPAALLLGFWLLVVSGLQVYDLFRFQNEVEVLSETIAGLFKEGLPESRRMVNPRAQLEREQVALKEKIVGGKGGFLDLLAGSSEGISEVEEVKLTALLYQENRLEVVLQTNELQLLDEVKNAVSENNELKVDIQSASSRKNEVRGRLVVVVR